MSKRTVNELLTHPVLVVLSNFNAVVSAKVIFHSHSEKNVYIHFYPSSVEKQTTHIVLNNHTKILLQ